MKSQASPVYTTNPQRHLLGGVVSALTPCSGEQQSTRQPLVTNHSRVSAELITHIFSSGLEDELSTKKALQTVVAGQQAENLLDFDDAPALEGQPSGLAATTLTSTPAAANLLAGTSSNPLDDLVSIFGGAGLGGGGLGSNGGLGNGGGLGGSGGLGNGGGLGSLGGGAGLSAAPVDKFAGLSFVTQSSVPSANTPGSGMTSPVQQKPQEDLLGLF